MVRAATTRVLDLDLTQEAKPVILSHAMKAAGLGWAFTPRTRSFDVEGFTRGLGHAEAEALRMQRWVDEEGGFLSLHDLTTALNAIDLDPIEARNHRRNARTAAVLTRATHASREAYERTLAASGSAIEAAARAMEEIARLMPEAAR